MAVSEFIRYENIKEKIKDITSENSNSLARVIINDNFKLFKGTTESLWCAIDNIYDYINNGLGSVGLHTDVDLTGIGVGQVMVWDGVKFIAGDLGGGGGGGAQFLNELLDVEDYTFPLADNTILKYDLGQNLFVTADFSFFELIESSNVPQDAQIKMLYLDASNEFAPLNVGADNTFLFVNSGIPAWSLITMDKIDDLDLSGAVSGENYLIHYNGTGFELIASDATSGIRNVLLTGVDILVPEYHQYIVHQSFTLDGGTIEIEGELVIL